MKSCPRCKALTFEDMEVCYNCLYRFELRKAEDGLMPVSIADFGGAALRKAGDKDCSSERMDVARKEGGPEVESTSAAMREVPKAGSEAEQQNTGEGIILVLQQMGDVHVRRILLGRNRTLSIGRSPDCDIVLTPLNISRKHARVTLQERGILVEDLASANGTYLNGVRVAHEEIAAVGDIIRIGKVSILLERMDN